MQTLSLRCNTNEEVISCQITRSRWVIVIICSMYDELKSVLENFLVLLDYQNIGRWSTNLSGNELAASVRLFQDHQKVTEELYSITIA